MLQCRVFLLVTAKLLQIRSQRPLINRHARMHLQLAADTALADGFRQEPLTGNLVPVPQQGWSAQCEEGCLPADLQLVTQLAGLPAMLNQKLQVIDSLDQISFLQPGRGQLTPRQQRRADFRQAMRSPAAGRSTQTQTSHEIISGLAKRHQAGLPCCKGGRGLHADQLRIGILTDADQGMSSRMAASTTGTSQGNQLLLPGLQARCSQIRDPVRHDRDLVRHSPAILITADQVIQAQATGPHLMQGPDIDRQFGPQTSQLAGPFREVQGCHLPADLGSYFQLVEHRAFGRFVRVQLQAERAQAHRLQPAVDNGQRSHFFSYKQHRLALRQGIADHVGDRLRLAGTGRAMQDKALAFAGRLDGIKLGSIGNNRRQDRRLQIWIIRNRFRRPRQAASHQAGDNLVAQQVLTAIAQVIPHDKLGKGENAEECAFDDIPAVLGHNPLAHRRKYQRQVYPVLVLRQRVKALNDDPEILPEHLQQGDVHLRIFITQANDVAFQRRAPDNINRQQHQRGIAGLLADCRLIPLQQAEGQVQCIGTVLLLGLPGQPIQGQHRRGQFALAVKSPQTTILEFIRQQRSVLGHQAGKLKAIIAGSRWRPVPRTGQGLEISPAGQDVLKLAEAGG